MAFLNSFTHIKYYFTFTYQQSRSIYRVGQA